MAILLGPAAFVGEVTGDCGAAQRGLPGQEQQQVWRDLLQTSLDNRGGLGLLKCWCPDSLSWLPEAASSLTPLLYKAGSSGTEALTNLALVFPLAAGRARL